MKDVYKDCPQYDAGRFLLRLVTMDDAPDLLCCYGDPKAAPLFNSDNCTSDFIYRTLREMQDLHCRLAEKIRGRAVRALCRCG